MAERYYWLKLKRDFFKRHDIQIIESMPNGKDYILFYMKLMCESVDHEGKLRFSDEIPYSVDMLATITNTNVSIVRDAVKVFTQLHMMELMDDGTFFMNEVNKMIGSETKWAEKKRNFREQIKTVNESTGIEYKGTDIGGEDIVLDVSSPCPEVSSKCPIEKELELEKEKELEKELEKDRESERAHAREDEPITLGIYNNVYLTRDELNEMIKAYPDDYKDMIENLSTYMRSNGKLYADHFATMMRWKHEDLKKAKAPPGKNDYWSEFDKLKEEYHDEG